MRLISVAEPWNAHVDSDEVVLAITRDELAGLANSIGEALQAVDEWEFDTRVGLIPEDARRLRDEISMVLRTSFKPE
jgi:hypothetical protein